MALLILCALPVACAPLLSSGALEDSPSTAVRLDSNVDGSSTAATSRAAGLIANDVPPPQLDLSRSPKGAPNVVVILLDDVGFGAAETFGGPIPTPALDSIAAAGLRYNRFHTTGICSPTRASLLTGRNPHAVGVGAVLNSASSYPGYRGMLPDSAATIAEILRTNGYSTALFGKWHLTPDWESSPAGPFNRWPTGQGFDRFYGFLGGETHQFEPNLYEGTQPVRRPPGDDYHLTEDLAEHAIEWMQLQRAIRPDRPFFLYFAPGATHAPVHVPKPWIERFRGQFDHGWDEQRERTFARQKARGVIPEEAELTPRPAQIPGFDSLSADERVFAIRLMETYAGFLAHTDAQVGQLAEALREMEVFEDTLFIYVVGDNGASAEGGVLGGWNYFARFLVAPEDPALNAARANDVGGPDSYPQYPAGWAWAMGTPFQWTKTIASHLGATRNALALSWPARIEDAGGLRAQYAHVSDVMPTILAAAGIPAPNVVNGVDQQRIDGQSLVYSFDEPSAPSRRRTQYYEVFGHRSIYHEGWMASAFRGLAPWDRSKPLERTFEEDPWELYELDRDFSQARDLAAKFPEKLRGLQDLFLSEAARNNVLPLNDSLPTNSLPNLVEGRTRFVYHEGAVGIPEAGAPSIQNRSYTITAELDVPAAGAEGVVVTEGGGVAGWALYVAADGRPTFTYNLFGLDQTTIVGGRSLPVGKTTLRVDFDYDGGGYGKGGEARLSIDDDIVGMGRIERTSPAFFSIDETFDVGTDTGAPAGDYPPGWDFTGRIERVRFDLR
jgi:arylsulfatase A-like enzyme